MTLKTKNNLLQSPKLKTVMVLFPHEYGFSWIWHGLPWRLSGKESICQCRRHRRRGFDPWVGNIPYKRKWQPDPVFLPGKSHGQRSLVGYSSWGGKSQTRLSLCVCARARAHTHTHTHTHRAGISCWVLYVSTSGRTTCHFQKRKLSLREIKLPKGAQG